MIGGGGTAATGLDAGADLARPASPMVATVLDLPLSSRTAVGGDGIAGVDDVADGLGVDAADGVGGGDEEVVVVVEGLSVAGPWSFSGVWGNFKGDGKGEKLKKRAESLPDASRFSLSPGR